MIGQKNLQSVLTEQIYTEKLPKFILLVGQRGSGKHLMADFIIQQLSLEYPNVISYVLPDVKTDTIRDMIIDVYKSDEVMVCVIPNADTMAVNARNSLLKVTEEPPQNVYFVMTVESEGATMDTILSRATTFHMDRYSPAEILEYFYDKGGKEADADKVKQICSTPGEVNLLLQEDGLIKSFYDYVNKVVDNIALVSGANSFRIADKLAVKTETGYDLKLFWKAFMTVCFEHLKESPFQYTSGINITSKYLQELRNSSLNKQMLFDNWLLDIRQEWFEYAEDQA